MSSRNLVPGRYRGVAVARAQGPLDFASLRERFLGREAYFKTRFLVVLGGEPYGTNGAFARVDGTNGPFVPNETGPTALLAVTRAEDGPLFSPIASVQMLAGPEECAFLHRPEVDVAIPSALAQAAGEVPGARAVIVQGRYEHVNFILDPAPRRVVVREVVPPYPAKLADQARRLLEVGEDLPPLRLEADVVNLDALATEHPAEHYLLPCRGGGGSSGSARVSYLDERPPEADWTLIGCARSREIHRWFYGRDAPGPDTCPKADVAASGPGAVLTKCCLQQESIDEGTAGETEWVSVPWGSSLEHVRDALGRLARRVEPTWSPA